MFVFLLANNFRGCSSFAWAVSYFFSSFDKIFCLTSFVFDIDDFHFRVYGKMGNAFPRNLFGQKFDREPNICYIRVLKIMKKKKKKKKIGEGDFH